MKKKDVNINEIRENLEYYVSQENYQDLIGHGIIKLPYDEETVIGCQIMRLALEDDNLMKLAYHKRKLVPLDLIAVTLYEIMYENIKESIKEGALGILLESNHRLN